MSVTDMMETFCSSAPFMASQLYGRYEPMRPADCLKEDDFWDKRLGKPPAPCPDDDDLYDDEY